MTNRPDHTALDREALAACGTKARRIAGALRRNSTRWLSGQQSEAAFRARNVQLWRIAERDEHAKRATLMILRGAA